MAEREGGETIRQMLAGFNSMQMQLGLLPQQTGQQPLGVQLTAPPPPPPVMHPGAISAQATMAGQQMMMHTMQAAQMTRYVPPPSMPMGGGGFGWGGTMNAIAAQQFNPYVAGAIGGGGGGGGMPSAMFATSPQYGMYRPSPMMGGPAMSAYARIPSIYNPFAPTMPSPHFSTPAMQQYQMLQAHQTHGAATLGGLVEGGLGFGGAMLGGALGSAFGPLGSMAGSWLGGKVGGAFSNMTIGPAMDDIRRGRMLQNTTAPFLVTGANLNPYTGQGLERGAARETATGLRQLSRDYDFQRTGFNTHDVMRMTQLASDQGLLATAHNPDEIVRKMKDISKAVKSLIQITGDPDIRNALSSLGQMRNLGFEGLSGQMGAVANRAMFARMAGVSQSAMNDQYGMPGAMMAQGIGLAGATGYGMGMAGGAHANIAVSAGAFSDLQLARGGGKQGVAQTNLMAQLGAANQDIYMAAALRRNAQGKLDIDVDAYRRAQTMPLSQVSSEAGERLRSIGPQGIFELSTRKQEFKDRLQQSLSPTEQMLNVVRQAQGLQKEVGNGMTLGSALRTMIGSSPAGQGMSDSEREQTARTLELQFSSRKFYDGEIQQLKVQRREAQDRARALRERYRTPGFVSGSAQNIREGLGGLSDALTSPFRQFAERSDRIEEDNAAFNRGERIQRHAGSSLIQTDEDRQMALRAMGSSAFKNFGDYSGDTEGRAAYAMQSSDVGRTLNRYATMFGLSSYTDVNKRMLTANRARSSLFGIHTTYGSLSEANKTLKDVLSGAGIVKGGIGMSSDQAVAAMSAMQTNGAAAKPGFNASALIAQAARRVVTALPTASANGVWSAGAAGAEVFKKQIVHTLMVDGGMDAKQAEAAYNNDPNISKLVAREIYRSGNQKAIETLNNSLDTSGRSGVFGNTTDRDKLERDVAAAFQKTGLDTGYGVAEKDIESAKQVIKANDPRVIAYVAAQAELADTGGGALGEMRRSRAAALVDRISSGFKTDPAGREAFMKKVETARAAAAGGHTMAALRNVLGKDVGTGSGETGEGRFSTIKDAIGQTMASTTVKSVLQQIEKETGQTGLSDLGLEGAIGKLSEDDIGKIQNTSVRNAALRLKRGEKGALKDLQAASLSQGPKSGVEITSNESGTGKLDSQIAALEDARQTLGTSAEDNAQQVFADTVELFASAMKDFKAATEDMRFNRAHPHNAGGN